jgi:hypothetical protein
MADHRTHATDIRGVGEAAIEPGDRADATHECRRLCNADY